jgi:hypothetical protein
VLGDFYGHTPAEALILDADATLVDPIEPSLEAIRQQLIAWPVLHFDESGLRVEGQLNWLHVASTEELTYYTVHPKRGQEGMRAMGILPAFQGRAVHDHRLAFLRDWPTYFAFDHCLHALCNAHHLRELQFVGDQYQQSWAEEMSQLLLDIKAEVEATLLEQMSLAPERLTHFQQRYDELISQGLDCFFIYNHAHFGPPFFADGSRPVSIAPHGAPVHLLNVTQSQQPLNLILCHQRFSRLTQGFHLGKAGLAPLTDVETGLWPGERPRLGG